jgi:hypothetical protein
MLLYIPCDLANVFLKIVLCWAENWIQTEFGSVAEQIPVNDGFFIVGVFQSARHIDKFASKRCSSFRGQTFWNSQGRPVVISDDTEMGPAVKKWHEGKKSRSTSIALKFSDFWFQLNSEITCRLFSKNFLSIGLNPIHTCWIVKLGEMSHALMSHAQMLCLLISRMLSFCALNYGLLNCDMLIDLSHTAKSIREGIIWFSNFSESCHHLRWQCLV